MACSLGDGRNRGIDGIGERRVGFRKRLAAFLEPRGIEQILDHAQKPIVILQYPLPEAPRLFLLRSEQQCLGCKANARERTFELVRDSREKVLLPSPELRIVADRARQDRQAAEQHRQKEAAFP